MSIMQIKEGRSFKLLTNVYLRSLTIEDITSDYIQGLNDPEVTKYLVLKCRPDQTYETVKNYIQLNYGNNKNILFGVFIDGSLRGTIRVHDIDIINRVDAWIGITIFDKNYWGNNWGSFSIKEILKICECELGLKRIYAGIYPDNKASQRAFHKSGFYNTKKIDEDDYGKFEIWVAIL